MMDQANIQLLNLVVGSAFAEQVQHIFYRRRGNM